MRDLIKRILGIERLDKIAVSMAFKEHPPRIEKLAWRTTFYNIFKELAVPIVINKDNVLLDGYTSYLIMRFYDKKYVKVKRV